MSRVKISGVSAGSRLDEMIQDYFTALAERNYRTAEASLTMVAASTNRRPIVEEMIRLTHEMEPPA